MTLIDADAVVLWHQLDGPDEEDRDYETFNAAANTPQVAGGAGTTANTQHED
jgi:hypothetical protein